MNLRQKTIAGLKWSVISQIARQATQFTITVILARLLSPGDFGTIAMVTVFTNFVSIFSEMGMSGALIQNQDVNDRHFASAHWLNVFVGLCLSLLLIAASPFIAAFYNTAIIKPVLMVLSINFFLSSFVIIQQTILTKEMDFKKLAVRDIAALFFSGIIGIVLAYHDFGVWSLVWQRIAYTFINVVLLWTLSRWRPSFTFASSDIKDIFHVSSNLTAFSFINYFVRNLDQLLIGKFLGSEALGFYSLAYKLMLFPVQNIASVINGVMFPAFSIIQKDLVKVREVYLKLIKTIALITCPLMAGLFAVAPEFTSIVYGSKWLQIVPLIRVLTVCGILQSIGTNVGIIYTSQGRPEIQLKMAIGNTALSSIAIILGLKWGVYGVTVFYTTYYAIWFHFSHFIANKVIDLKYSHFYSSLTIPFLTSFAMLLSMLLVKHFLHFESYAVILCITLAVGSIIYVLLLVKTRTVSIVNNRVLVN